MPARAPEEASSLVFEAFRVGDMEAALALYEPTAVIVNGDGTMWSGTAAIRKDFESVISLRAKFQLKIVRAITQGDIAFVTATWKAEWTGTDGHPSTAAGQTIEVLRRQPDGTWLYAIHEGHAHEWFGRS